MATMATTTSPSPSPSPFSSRFSRLGLGLKLKSTSNAPTPTRSRRNGGEKQTEDEWYIPYSGPYEPPHAPVRPRRNRDSWGDLIHREEENDVDTALASVELRKLYEVRNNGVSGDDHRNRTQSGVSGRTVSSGLVDPGVAQRRSTVSSTNHRPPVPSYISLDGAGGGGIGESPIPLTHQRNSSKEYRGTSITGIFAFGGSGQARNNKNASEKTSRKLSSKKQTPLATSRASGVVVGLGVGPATTSHRRSSSTGSNSLIGRNRDDNYDSYYFSAGSRGSQNPTTTTQHQHPYSGPPPEVTKLSISSPPQPTRHPYAYAFPSALHSDDAPKTIPPPSSDVRIAPNVSSNTAHVDTPKLTFTEPPPPPPLASLQKPTSANVPQFPIPSSSFSIQKGLKRLKNSVSTPDLRLGANSAFVSSQARNKVLSSKPSPTFKPKDRWLSAETWCDALLFPRPRLKIRQEGGEMSGGNSSSGRIVSPPGSPVFERPEGYMGGNGVIDQGVVASRVLAHSRSLVDLHQRSRRSPVAVDGQGKVMAVATSTVPPQNQNGTALSVRPDRPPRPKSWALDDLDLPTPVPSLARVIEEGEKFETQRKQWKQQAMHSFQNQRTRDMSRVRSKSLSQKGKRREEPRPSNIDLLAARAYLGNQLLTPLIGTRKLADSQVSFSGSPHSKSSHAQSNSVAKTSSKSPKSHSRTHSRSDSWGRSALKLAKTAACGLPIPGNVSPAFSLSLDTTNTNSNHGHGLESALRRDDTKIIRLADPATAVVAADEMTPVASNSPTPPDSVISDMRIGIALTTPPLVNNPTEVADAVRLPAHPYAQGGMYSYSTFVPASRNEAIGVGVTTDAAASEPVVHKAQSGNKARPVDGLTLLSPQRAKGPPPALYHPYAQPFTPESYVYNNGLTPYSRTDSNVPPPAKMWAQLSPGVVREILPGEILYSPYMSEHGDAAGPATGSSPTIYDTVGVGEALAYAVQRKNSKDSGLGTSEGHTVIDAHLPQPASVAAKRSYRQPVQYDTTRPPHLHLSKQEKKPSDPNSAHTYASSPLLHQQSPPPDLPRLNSGSSPSDYLPQPRTTSTSPESLSPPHSPRSFGNPDDLENYYDLFYKRSAPPSTGQRIPSEMTPTTSPSGSDSQPGRRHRTGSGLTSLARQLSEEFETLAMENDGSQYSRSSMITSSNGRRPTESTLEFVFEETSPPESSAAGRSPPGRATISPFQASPARIPEDISSSRTSSLVEVNEDPDENQTELLRLGLVESVLTPPPVANDHRSSFTGQLSLDNNQQHRPTESIEEGQQQFAASEPVVQPRVNSGLQPPSADPTRSSYMTTSTTSRMSGLSDFPAPPQRHPVGHTSLLTSYFDEAHSLSEANASRNGTPPTVRSASPDEEGNDEKNRRLTFGGEEEIEELIATLSSHSHSSHS